MRRRAALLGGRLAGLAVEQQAQGLTTNAATPAAGIFGIAGRSARGGRNVGQQQARGRAALPAAAVAQTRVQPQVLPLTRVDEFGATSILESEAMATFVPQQYENVDGRRIEDGRYAAFTKDLTGGWCPGWRLGLGRFERGGGAVPVAHCWLRTACGRRLGVAAPPRRRCVPRQLGGCSPHTLRPALSPASQAELAGVPKERQFTDKVRQPSRCCSAAAGAAARRPTHRRAVCVRQQLPLLAVGAGTWGQADHPSHPPCTRAARPSLPAPHGAVPGCRCARLRMAPTPPSIA